MTKNSKRKPIDELVFSTRNKAVNMYSRLFGVNKTNEILEKTFSNNIVVSKLKDAEKHGFKLIYGTDGDKKGVGLYKIIDKIGIDVAKCKEKYWAIFRENLLKYYDEETTDAIIEHYNPPIDVDDGIIHIGGLVDGMLPFQDDKPDYKDVGIAIEFYPRDVEEH
jgi:hypothetical protein